jgi:hypothetical protein
MSNAALSSPLVWVSVVESIFFPRCVGTLECDHADLRSGTK